MPDATAIYIASPEGDTGKSTIALGLLHRLAATVANVGVFRPIVRSDGVRDHILAMLLEHLDDLYGFYGEYLGCRVARKHIAWYTHGLFDANAFRQAMYQLDSTAAQRAAVARYFDQLAGQSERLDYNAGHHQPDVDIQP